MSVPSKFWFGFTVFASLQKRVKKTLYGLFSSVFLARCDGEVNEKGEETAGTLVEVGIRQIT